MSELPKGWATATLGEIADLQGGITKGQKRKPTDKLREVPYLRVANVQRGYIDLTEVKTIEATEAEIDELRLLPGDVLFNEGGDRDKLGRGWVWQGQIKDCIHQNHVFRARLRSKSIRPELISWFGNSVGQRYFNAEGKQTTNLASINLTKLRAFPVLLPPSEEQARITGELDSYLSRLDDAVANLERAKRNLKRYRVSVLKAAVEGRLVPTEARAQFHPSKWIPLGDLLASIEQGWSPLCEKQSSDDPAVWAVIKTTAVQSGCYLDTENKRLPSELTPKSNLEIHVDDILVTRAGPRSRAGIVCRVRSTRPRLILCDKVYRLRMNERVRPGYIELVLNSDTFQQMIERLKTGISDSGVNLTQKKLLALPVPVPELELQEETEREVEQHLSLADASSAIVDTNLQRCARLRQAILKWAFTGKLVDQDPQDEPASVLLNRLRAERA